MINGNGNRKRSMAALNWFQCRETQDDRLISQLQTFSQNFKDKEVEAKFFEHRMSQFISQFRICTVSQIFLNFAFCIYDYTFFNSFERSILRAILTFCLMSFLIVQTKIGLKWNTAINLFIVFNTLFNQGIVIDFDLLQIDPPVQWNVAILCNGLYALSNFVICSQWNWKFFIILSYFIQLSVIIENDLNWQPCILMFLLCLLLRIKDKQMKLSFLLLNQQNKNIMECKDVFDQCVPSSLLIIKIKDGDQQKALVQSEFSDLTHTNNVCEVLYANQFALRYLGCSDNQECAKELRKIKVNLEAEKTIDLITLLKQSAKEEMLINNQDYALGKESEILCCSIVQEIKFKKEIEIVLGSTIERFCDLSVKSCVWEGETAMLISLMETTDKIQHIGELKELNNYKDQLLATVSHDLKTPLNATQLMLYTIKEILKSKMPIEQAEIKNILQYVNDVISNNLMLISMINDLIDYSQIRKGSLRLQINAFILDDFLISIKKIFQSQTSQKNLLFLVEKLNFDSQIEMYTDQNRLKQILINLLSNSLKFTYSGHIKLKISIIDSVLEFVVEDTGIGMPKDVVVKLFQQYQTFNLGNMNQQGVGLGLVISKKLVGLLGPTETITVDSQEGVGTKLQFKIFIQKGQNNDNYSFFDKDNNHQQPKLTQSTKTLRRLTLVRNESCDVLIVDDVIFNITIFKVILEKSFKCDVQDAYNGYEAVQRVKSGLNFKLIFMDISMPVMNGYEATKLIREYEKETNNHRSIIIICSAYTLEQEFQNLRESGADGLIEKPVSIKKLNEILIKYQFIT